MMNNNIFHDINIDLPSNTYFLDRKKEEIGNIIIAREYFSRVKRTDISRGLHKKKTTTTVICKTFLVSQTLYSIPISNFDSYVWVNFDKIMISSSFFQYSFSDL